MDTNSIREAVLSRPFKPFTLRMDDGREYFVPHSEFVAVAKRVVMLFDQKSDAGLYLEPILIASLQFEEPSEQKK